MSGPRTGRRLLIVEDDATFSRTLSRSFERRGYEVRAIASAEALGETLATFAPPSRRSTTAQCGASGLACVEALHARDAEMRIIVLTGFASIATAVEAVKLGATNYLTKPSTTDDIEAAFGQVAGNADAAISTRPTSIKTTEWEQIHQALAETDFNVSEAARRLGMHRRTLARRLAKQHVK